MAKNPARGRASSKPPPKMRLGWDKLSAVIRVQWNKARLSVVPTRQLFLYFTELGKARAKPIASQCRWIAMGAFRKEIIERLKVPEGWVAASTDIEFLSKIPEKELERGLALLEKSEIKGRDRAIMVLSGIVVSKKPKRSIEEWIKLSMDEGALMKMTIAELGQGTYTLLKQSNSPQIDEAMRIIGSVRRIKKRGATAEGWFEILGEKEVLARAGPLQLEEGLDFMLGAKAFTGVDQEKVSRAIEKIAGEIQERYKRLDPLRKDWALGNWITASRNPRALRDIADREEIEWGIKRLELEKTVRKLHRAPQAEGELRRLENAITGGKLSPENARKAETRLNLLLQKSDTLELEGAIGRLNLELLRRTKGGER